jgi:competence protein ComEC
VLLSESYRNESEQRRTFLWAPVLYAAGILAYYQMPREPLFPALALLAALAALFACYARNKGRLLAIWSAIALAALGGLAAKVRTDNLAGPVLQQALFGTVQGTVVSVQQRADRPPRLVLRDVEIEGSQPPGLPERIRISLIRSDRIPEVGRTIAIRGRIGPVPGPAVPGGYDPRRAAFFEGIGASGFALGRWQERPDGRMGGPAARMEIGISRFRQSLVDRILENVPGTAGAVAAALLVGERGHIPAETVQHLRDAGLAHILAISGLHMALFAGTVFFAMRAIFALSPTLSLTRPIKKWSAVAALVSAFFYLLLSGGNVATLRAFIMAGIMFLAVIAERPALSMRNLAIAALIILTLQPESVVEPGFQMSFAAVAALIAFYEAWRERRWVDLAEPPATLAGRSFRVAGRSIGAIAMTTIIAGLATGPIGAFYFNHVALYSLFGNLLAMPLLTLIVMPFGLLSLVMMPFGLEHLPLTVMATGTDAILTVASAVSARDGATITVPSVGPAVYLVYLAGFLWLCLWRLRWRWLGLFPVAIASVFAATGEERPDILVSNTGTTVAVRNADGALRVSGSRPSQFVLEQWFRREGRDVPEKAVLKAGIDCDRSACLAELPDGGTLAHIRRLDAFAEECKRSAIIVTSLDAPDDCQAMLVIDAGGLARSGAMAIHLTDKREQDGQESSEGQRTAGYRIVSAWPSTRRPWQAPAELP